VAGRLPGFDEGLLLVCRGTLGPTPEASENARRLDPKGDPPARACDIHSMARKYKDKKPGQLYVTLAGLVSSMGWKFGEVSKP
jgi:hypothetical protein